MENKNYADGLTVMTLVSKTRSQGSTPCLHVKGLVAVVTLAGRHKKNCNSEYIICACLATRACIHLLASSSVVGTSDLHI